MANDPVLKTNSKEVFVGKKYIKDDKGTIKGYTITARAYENLNMFEGDNPSIQLNVVLYGEDGKPTDTIYLTKCEGAYEADTAYEELRVKLSKDYYQSPAKKRD